MTTYVLRDGKLIEKHLAPPLVRKHGRAPYVMGSISERVSPIDQSVISTREQLAAHNKRHGVVDVGDDIVEKAPASSTREIRQAAGEAYQKAAQGAASKAQKTGDVPGDIRILNDA